MASLVAGVVALCPDLDADAVREITTTALTDAQINNFINVAYYMTIPLTGELSACGGQSMQCEIIKFLAAHGITVWERQAKSESVAGEWSIAYMGRDGFGLDASLYGQQAKAMDCSGILAKLGLKGVLLKVADYETLEELPTEA